MQSIVEDVEDERETEGSPTNSQRYEEDEGIDLMSKSRGVDDFECLPRFGPHQSHQSHHGQAE